MEENETEWMCPNCKKKKKQEESLKKQPETKPAAGGNISPKKAQTPTVTTSNPGKEKKEASKVCV